MSKIKLVTLDLDNTLWDVERIIVKAEQDMVAWLEQHAPDSLSVYQGPDLADIRLQVFQKHADKSHDLSFMRLQVLFEVMRRCGMQDRAARQIAQQAFDVFFEGRNRVELFDGAQDMLEQLNSQYQVYALTNGNANIEKAGISRYFHGAFSSADVGNKKPHPDMFHAPLTALNLLAPQAVHVGDHLLDDIQGASDIGMHSIWVNFDPQQQATVGIAPTKEVSHLNAVHQALQDISSN